MTSLEVKTSKVHTTAVVLLGLFFRADEPPEPGQRPQAGTNRRSVGARSHDARAVRSSCLVGSQRPLEAGELFLASRARAQRRADLFLE